MEMDSGMWVTDWECGSLVTNYPRATAIFLIFVALSNSAIRKNISFAL